jgi:hypothetical protein
LFTIVLTAFVISYVPLLFAFCTASVVGHMPVHAAHQNKELNWLTTTCFILISGYKEKIS